MILNTAMACGVVRPSSGGPILTVDRTIFEMWLGDSKSTEAVDPGIVA